MEINFIEKEIPKKIFILSNKINNKYLINELILDIKKQIKKSTISGKTNVKGESTEYDALIKNENFHNFLREINKDVKKIYKKNFIIHNVWGNICKKDNEVLLHTHEGVTAFCGILYLTDNGPGTFFPELNMVIKEEVGKFVLFHPILKHYVPKIENDIERITLAFNMNEVFELDTRQVIKIKNEI